ncbi:MAG TPA: hypothetical protein VIT45_04475 [Allosphingosinicella sp.]
MAEQGRVAPRLRLCRGCRQFVVPDRPDCRFCGGDLDLLEEDYEARQAAVREAADDLRRAMERHKGMAGRRRS